MQEEWVLSNKICRYENDPHVRHACAGESQNILRWWNKQLGIKLLKYNDRSDRRLVWLENIELNLLVDIFKSLHTSSPTLQPTKGIILAEVADMPTPSPTLPPHRRSAFKPANVSTVFYRSTAF